jgi:hypothetical protein
MVNRVQHKLVGSMCTRYQTETVLDEEFSRPLNPWSSQELHLRPGDKSHRRGTGM